MPAFIGTTLDRFLRRPSAGQRTPDAALAQVIQDLALAGKIISRDISRAGLTALDAQVGTPAGQSELQQTLDAEAHIRLVRALTNGGAVGAVLSKEVPDLLFTGHDQAPYVVALDPLDGTANIAAGVNVGTIFSVYRRVSALGQRPSRADFFQGGRQQVAAGYMLYGSSTLLLLTTGSGVSGFTYDHSLGEFLLSHPNLRIPFDGNVYSCNDGQWLDFPPFVQAYLTYCRERRFNSRYIGSLVADFHRNLLAGGIYLYPPNSQFVSGKPRLLYEAYPLAWLMEQAGGEALAAPGAQLLDVPIRELHQRTPFYVGSPGLVAGLQQA
jgi:fructose-1,6-bisphosphatase I